MHLLYQSSHPMSYQYHQTMLVLSHAHTHSYHASSITANVIPHDCYCYCYQEA